MHDTEDTENVCHIFLKISKFKNTKEKKPKLVL